MSETTIILSVVALLVGITVLGTSLYGYLTLYPPEFLRKKSHGTPWIRMGDLIVTDTMDLINYHTNTRNTI